MGEENANNPAVMVEVKKLNREEAIKLAAVLRAGGITTDLPTAVIMHSLIGKFMEKGNDLNIAELTRQIEAISADPEFASESKEKA